MKKILSCLILSLILMACNSNDLSGKLPDDFNEKMLFEECYGDTAGEEDFCFEFLIEVLNETGEQKIKLSIDGYQTSRRIICDVSNQHNEYKATFNSYDEEDIHYSDDFAIGDEVFIIVKKNNEYYIKNFNSPFDGQINQKEYLLKPIAAKELFYPKKSYDGIDALFDNYSCDVTFSSLEVELNTESIDVWEAIEWVVLEGIENDVNFGGKYILLPWGCGSDCQTGVIIDAGTGDIFKLPTSVRGLEYRADSLLLIVNPPSLLDAENNRPDYAYPAYYHWNDDNEFILLHDTGTE